MGRGVRSVQNGIQTSVPGRSGFRRTVPEKKNTAGRVSRVLCPERIAPLRASAIYLGRESPPRLVSNLPPDIGRATLRRRYTWSCIPSDVRPDVSPHPRWALTPPFHPYHATVRRFRGGCFLLRLLSPLGDLPVRKDGALRCPDFPLPLAGQRQSLPAVFGAKVVKNRE